MSEFSESYHLLSNNQQDGVNLLQKASVAGFVYPESKHWVTILPEGPIFEPNMQLISQNSGILLHYIHAEDHGWSLSVFEGSTRVFHYECGWEEDVENNFHEINMSTILETMNRNPDRKSDVSAIELSKYLDISDIEEIFELNPAECVAELIGLTNYQWFSYEYVEMDLNEDTNSVSDKGIIIVKA